MDDDSLIIQMMTDAWLDGDKERALLLHDHWMVEFPPEFKAELKMLYGDDYEKCFRGENYTIQ